MESSKTAPPFSKFGPRGTNWKEVCEEVDALGGDWGKVGQYHPSMVTRIRSGALTSVDPKKYEVTARRDPETGKHWLWMRRMKRGEWMKEKE